MNIKKVIYILIVLLLVVQSNSFAQKSKRRKRLEARRVQLQKDKVYINALLSNAKRKEKNLLSDLKDTKDKIKISEKLITVINTETKELEKDIYANQLIINKNEKDLKELKKEYATIILKSYKSKSKNNKILLLLSSESFFQAYKRFQYMKQYASYRKEQGLQIQEKTQEIQVFVDSLKQKKQLKQELLDSKKQEQNQITKSKKKKEKLLTSIKQKENKYKKQIQSFIAEEKRINAQIDRLIKEAIRASNKKSGKKATSKKFEFTLTAEAKALASKFYQNRGKLPWPVKKGYVSTYYGRQPHPVYKTLTIQSNGVRITTQKNSKARAVFEGEVIAIQVMTGNRKAVLIKHGNYITVYKNLENILVKKGNKVKTKQEIGTIFTDKITGKTILDFVLLLNTKTQNPASWIYRM